MKKVSSTRSFWLALFGLALMATTVSYASIDTAFAKGFELFLPGVDSNCNQDSSLGATTTCTTAFWYSFHGHEKVINTAHGHVTNECHRFLVTFKNFAIDIWHPEFGNYIPATESSQVVGKLGNTKLVACSNAIEYD